MSRRTLAERTRRRRDAALAGHRADAGAARDFLTDPDPVVRSTALRALERAGELPAATLVSAVRDAAPQVRRAAAELVGRAGDEGAPALDDALLVLLADADPTVVEMASWAAGERERPTPAVVERLCALTTDHDDALVREAAVAALGALGDERGLPAVLAATHDKATVRRRAVLALAPFDGPEVDAALHDALADRDWQVRQAAEDLLA
jgi:HEAT repeat protein